MATKKELVRFRLNRKQVEKLEELTENLNLTKNELLTQIVSDFLVSEEKKEIKYEKLIKEEADKLRKEFSNKMLNIERRVNGG